MKVIKNYQVSLKLLAELTLLLIILINLLSLFHSTIYFVTTHQANYYFNLNGTELITQRQVQAEAVAALKSFRPHLLLKILRRSHSSKAREST